ncbi:hypothetical protein [Streptomyces sp. NPDC047046]|uniref:hypothetical protein n=1 Tax=Streptomyces sp. NPDC047046 TaxID=3155378 RepID=UPI0033CD6E15
MAWSTRLGLPGGGTVATSRTELLTAAAAGPCVVKDPYGVSGQGNTVVDTPARLALIERHLERAHGRIELVVEPLHARAEDFAAHLTLTPSGRITWHGIRQVLNEGHSYRGSTEPTAALLRRLDRADYRTVVESVAARTFAAGRCATRTPSNGWSTYSTTRGCWPATDVVFCRWRPVRSPRPAGGSSTPSSAT